MLRNEIYFNTNRDFCCLVLSFVTLIEQPMYFHSPNLPIIIPWKVLEQILSTCCVDQKTHWFTVLRPFIFFEAIKLVCANFTWNNLYLL